MELDDFDYDLPPERIAQEPADPRDAARLLVDDAGTTRHRTVADLADELRPGDLLVVNDTRVRPARLQARRATGGAVELLLVEPSPSADAAGAWRAMVRPAKRLRAGEELVVDGAGLVVRALEREVDPARGADATPFWRVELFDPDAREARVEELLERAGRMPLPPYIERARDGDPRDATDRERYQTVYARHAGAVAAPTAGLHLTPELLERLAQRGVERAEVTLHVGLGTFLPVTASDPDEHVMHAERYELGVACADAIERCRARGGRVVAVGTTSVRVLESCAGDAGRVTPGVGQTRLFVRPGFGFRCVDVLLTNFHLPRSTLLMLVAAFVGRERMLGLYAEAIERGYRFYSYGDAMLLSAHRIE